MTRRISIAEVITAGPRLIASAVILLGLLAMSSCGSDGDSTGPEPVVPRVASLSDSTLSPGDTLVVTGSNFAAAAADNRVVFNNSLARASQYAAAGGRLEVVVPANANSGGLFVISLGVSSNKINVTIERNVGDVWVMGGGTSYGFTV
ncbi:MAG: IPT/TIG domain-containing protein, partial [bacterium]